MRKDSEFIELGDTGMVLENGVLKNEDGKEVSKKTVQKQSLCPDCQMPFGFCQCDPEFEEWDH